jgi:hypothetical protein
MVPEFLSSAKERSMNISLICPRLPARERNWRVAQRHDSPFALKPDQKERIWDASAVMRSLLDGPLAKASGDSIFEV